MTSSTVGPLLPQFEATMHSSPDTALVLVAVAAAVAAGAAAFEHAHHGRPQPASF
jgi:hypothetical protein